MSGSDNAALRVGVLARGQRLDDLIALVGATPDCAVVGLSGDRRPDDAAIPYFDDVRALCSQASLDALVIDGEPRGLVPVTRAALEFRVPLWRPAPLASGFTEGVELLRATATQNAALHCASWWEVAEPAYAGAQGDDALAAADVRSMTLTIDVDATAPAWSGGPQCYAALEALVAIRGLPEGVQALTVPGPSGEGDGGDERFVGALLRFPLGGPGVLAVRGEQPAADFTLDLRGVQLARVVRPGEIVHRDHPDQPWHREAVATDWLTTDWRQFAAQVRGGQAALVSRSNERHLAVLALLDAIRLAARTGQIERPQVFYEVQGWREPGV